MFFTRKLPYCNLFYYLNVVAFIVIGYQDFFIFLLFSFRVCCEGPKLPIQIIFYLHIPIILFIVFSVTYSIGKQFKLDAQMPSGVTSTNCQHDASMCKQLFEVHDSSQYDVQCSTLECLRCQFYIQLQEEDLIQCNTAKCHVFAMRLTS